MRTIQTKIFLMGVLMLATVLQLAAQNKNWTLEDCFDYALSKNIDVLKSSLSIQEDELSLAQSKSNLLPSVEGSIGKNFNWNKNLNTETNQYGSLDGSNNTSYGLSANVNLFNGFKLKKQIQQAKLNLLGGRYYSEAVKESVELNILDAYLQILYAGESVNNAKEQISATSEQLILAAERLDAGIISQSDYLQIKSELASEKLTLANANSTLLIAKVNLMQLIELPLDNNFAIVSPDMTNLLREKQTPNANEIYLQALGIKPQIQQASMNLESVILDKNIAKADRLPSLSLSAGLSSGWSSELNDFNYGQQLKNQISPSLGFSLSIPIFQKNQVKTNIKMADIAIESARLDEIDTKNELRKNIEQASVDVLTAQFQYEASLEQQESSKESYLVASEKYEQGILNSVDLLVVKTDMITSESDLLQAKYNLIFSFKILDFYKGIPLSLSK